MRLGRALRAVGAKRVQLPAEVGWAALPLSPVPFPATTDDCPPAPCPSVRSRREATPVACSARFMNSARGACEEREVEGRRRNEERGDA